MHSLYSVAGKEPPLVKRLQQRQEPLFFSMRPPGSLSGYGYLAERPAPGIKSITRLRRRRRLACLRATEQTFPPGERVGGSAGGLRSSPPTIQTLPYQGGGEKCLLALNEYHDPTALAEFVYPASGQAASSREGGGASAALRCRSF